MSKLKRYGKIILFDSLAALCFIGVIAFGWLPGPGGLPLFIAGLGLLAVNHDWAERWLETVKYKSKSFKKILFPPTPWIRYTYDVVSVVLFVTAGYLYFQTTSHFASAVCIAVACFGFFVFLLNRERLDKLSSLFRRKVTKTKP
jgi:hypothetical protein